MTIKELFIDYITDAHMMQLATTSGQQPWICTVYFVYDPDSQEIYWFSSPQRRHSRELEANKRVAIAIVKPHAADAKDKQGFQLEGAARRLMSNELDRAYQLYAAKFGLPEAMLEQARLGDDQVNTFWAMKPEQIQTMDNIHFSGDPVQREAFK